MAGRRFSFQFKDEIADMVNSQIRDIVAEIVETEINKEEAIDKFSRMIESGEPRILILKVLMKNLDMHSGAKTICSFDDVIALVSVVEDVSISELKRELDDYGIVLTADRTIGFALNYNAIKVKIWSEVYPSVKVESDKVVYSKRNYKWYLNKIYVGYLHPYRFWLGDKGLLRVRAKHCYIFIAANYLTIATDIFII